MKKKSFLIVLATVSLLLIRTPAVHSLPDSSAIPRTATGQPNFEGVWDFATMTPLERSPNLQGRATFTAQEAADFERQTVQRRNMDRRDGGAAADLNRAYNDAWYDYGDKLAFVRGVYPTSLITDPPDGRIPPLTPQAQQLAAERAAMRRAHQADGPEDRSLSERCLSYNAGPPLASAPYNNNLQIVQTPVHIVLFNEMVHEARVVPLENRPHLPPAVRQFQGDPRGRWDRDTLVVDTTNFTDDLSFHGTDDHLHLVERLTLLDSNTILYEFTIDDPTVFTRPWTAAMPLRREDVSLYEYACHEGNYALEDILRGARAEERSTTSR